MHWGEPPSTGDSPNVPYAIFDEMIERQMNSFLVSYANYLNNKYDRKGGFLQQAIIYSNANAQKHRIVIDFKQHEYSSYNAAIHNDNYFIDSSNVVAFFGGAEKFIRIHEEQVAFFYGKGWPSSKLE